MTEIKKPEKLICYDDREINPDEEMFMRIWNDCCSAWEAYNKSREVSVEELSLIVELLKSELESVYCDTCSSADKDDDDNCYCDDCHRKMMNWSISDSCAERIARAIYQRIHGGENG